MALLSLLLVACSDPPPPDWIRGTPNPKDPFPQEETVEPSFLECPAQYPGPGRRWITYDDGGCLHGDSSSKIELLPDPLPGLSCPIHWTGDVTDTYDHAFTGVSSDIPLHTLKDYSAMILQVRGDGHWMRIRFPMLQQMNHAQLTACNSDDYDLYGQRFQCGDGSDNWKKVTIDLKNLKQEGWGNYWALNSDDMYRIQIQTLSTIPPHFDCDYRIEKLIR